MSTIELTSGRTVQTRRQFCTHACQAASLVALGPLAAACGGGSPTSASTGNAPALPVVTGTVSGRTVSVPLAGSALATNGSAALVQAGSGSFLVYRTGDQAFSVLTATCTHEGCMVAGFEGSTFVCPCHNSAFNTNGTVARGPATRSLTSYQWAVADGVLSFTV